MKFENLSTSEYSKVSNILSYSFQCWIQGDQFFNPERIKLKRYKNQLAELRKKKKPSTSEKKEMKQLESKINELNSVFEFYQERKRLYRADHLELEEDDETAVMTLDFFKAECGNAGEHDYHDLICVFASQKELEIPQSLLGKWPTYFIPIIHTFIFTQQLDIQIPEIEPISTMTSDQVELLFEKKPEKKERVPVVEKKENYSHRTQINKMKKVRNLPALNFTDANNYVPSLTYFHCITKKGI